jgi:hypothetical protein
MTSVSSGRVAVMSVRARWACTALAVLLIAVTIVAAILVPHLLHESYATPRWARNIPAVAGPDGAVPGYEPPALVTGGLIFFVGLTLCTGLAALAGFGGLDASASASTGRRSALGAARGGAELLVRQLTSAAVRIAGPRRETLAEPWESDVYQADGQRLPVARQLRHAAGCIRAAAVIRAEHSLGTRLDLILESRSRSLAVIGALFAVPITLVAAREGCYGLIVHADSLGTVAGCLYGTLHALRAWRDVHPPRQGKPGEPG